MMPRNPNLTMGFPPLRGAVRVIILFSVAVYLVILLLMSFAPGLGQTVLQLGVLNPELVKHGFLWQLVTYAFMYVDPLGFVLSLLGIYFLGWAVEDRIGSAGFYGLYFGSVVLSAVFGFVLSLTHVVAQGEAI